MYDLIVIGSSLGGLHAVRRVLRPLPLDFSIPIAIAQHRKEGSKHTLEMLLQRSCNLNVRGIEDKDVIERGCVYVAPSDYHSIVEDGHFALSLEPTTNYAIPSIDVLFESASAAFGARVIGIILTGMNDDGTRGLSEIKRRGGLTIAQDPTTAKAPEMPQAAIDAKAVDMILPLKEIGAFLANIRAGTREGNASQHESETNNENNGTQ